MSQVVESSFTIIPARSPTAYAAAAALFQAYAATLEISLVYQNFDTELASIPGPYAPPGELLLAYRSPISEVKPFSDSVPIGCIALRPISSTPGRCEMKRLYTTPEARGLGVGKALVKRIMSVATERGYKEIVLDSLASMIAARRIYEKEGFHEIEAYYDSPVEGTVFLQCELGSTQ